MPLFLTGRSQIEFSPWHKLLHVMVAYVSSWQACQDSINWFYKHSIDSVSRCPPASRRR